MSAAGALFYSDRLLEWAVRPILSETGALYFFNPSDAFTVKIKLALLAGFLISSPVILGQLWFFISPALHPHEKKAILPVVTLTSILFLAGAAFSFFKVVPVTLHFLIGMQTEWVRPMLSVSARGRHAAPPAQGRGRRRCARDGGLGRRAASVVLRTSRGAGAIARQPRITRPSCARDRRPRTHCVSSTDCAPQARAAAV